MATSCGLKSLLTLMAFAIANIIAFDLSAQPIAQRGSTPVAALTRSSLSWTVEQTRGKVIVTTANGQSAFTAFADKRSDTEETHYEIASLVGDVLSVRERSSWEGGAHPGHLSRLRTMRLTTRELDLPITALFPERNVVAALLRDTVVATALKGAPVATLAALIEAADGGCEIGFDELATSFAFHHIRGDQVAIRFGLPHGCEAMRGRYTEIGIYLPIPPALREALVQSQQRRQLMQTTQSARRR